jgi:NADH-quinone oxidoreductase subunit A
MLETSLGAEHLFLFATLCDIIHKVSLLPAFVSRWKVGMSALLIPILLLTAAALTVSLTLWGAGELLGPRRRSAVKQMPYESGMDPIHDTRRRFDVRFHLVAIAFVLFDVEILFLYPWAVASKHPQGLPAVAAMTGEESQFLLLVFAEVMIFLALFAMGLVYVWRKGVLQWR